MVVREVVGCEEVGIACYEERVGGRAGEETGLESGVEVGGTRGDDVGGTAG